MTAALRLGLMIDNPRSPPGWCQRLIARLADEPRLVLAAMIEPAASPTRGAMSPVARSVIGLEQRLLARPAKADHEPANALAAAAILPAAAVARLKALELDVIIDLTGDTEAWLDPALARHGVWLADWLGPAAGLRALAARDPVVRIALYRRTAGGKNPVCLAAATLNPKFAIARNAQFMREKAVSLVLRALKRTAATGRPDVIEGPVYNSRQTAGPAEISRYLRNLTANLTDRGLAYVRSMARRRPGMFYLKSGTGTPSDFDPAAASAHVSTGDSFFADPFLWERDGEMFCFFEEYDYRTDRGHISAGRLVGGKLVDVKPVLQTGYHLSFPFLFENDGDLYMMPETSEVRRIEVWKCVEFPARWERHATALDGICASDSTLNRIGGAWWLFTNLSFDPFRDMNSELYVFRVDGPALANIEAHAFNPVVMDSSCARNGGRILQIGGKLYRPCQENSHGRYGYGLRLMELRKLSLDDYEEVEVRAITPDFEQGIDGCHHLDFRCGQFVMDVRKKVGGYAR